MGDSRFAAALRKVEAAADRAAAIRGLEDDEVIEALAAASRGHNPFLANVLATEATNRMRRSRAALRHLGEGIVVVDAAQTITYANPAAERMLGRSRHELEGRPLPEAVHLPATGDDGGGAWLQDALAAGATHREDERFVRSDGKSFPVAYTAAPIVAEETLAGAVVVFGDITERKRTEQAIRESEERFRALADAAFEAVVVHEQGRILDANRAAGALFGVPCERLGGRSLLEFLTLRSQHAVLDAITRARSDPCELECRDASGRTFAAEAIGRAIPSGDGRVRVMALRDVTERREARRKLADAEEAYAHLFETHPWPSFVFDEVGRFLAINEAAERLSGWPRGDWIGRPFHDLVVADDLPQALDAFAAAIAGEERETRLRVRRREGTPIRVLVRARRVGSADAAARLLCVAQPEA